MDSVVSNFVRKSFPQVRLVKIFSDGPSSQFKNKFMAGFYHTLQRKGLRIKWHFFATSHGKGVVDCLAGTVKRIVWGAVSTRNVSNVQDVVTFAKITAQVRKSVNIQLCLKKDDDYSSHLELDKCFELATPIPGISKIHCIEPAMKGQIHHRLYSSQPSTIHEIEQSRDGEETHGITSVIEKTISSSNSSVDEESSDDTCSSNDTDFVIDDGNDTPLCTHAPSPAETTTTDEEESNIQIQLGLPHNVRALVNNQFQVPPYSSLLAELIVSKSIDFEGDPLINASDLQELEGLCSQTPSSVPSTPSKVLAISCILFGNTL